MYVPTYPADGEINRIFRLDGIRRDICTALRLNFNTQRIHLESSIFSGREYEPFQSDSIKLEMRNNFCDNENCKIRLCCPPAENLEGVNLQSYECNETASSETYSNYLNDPFYTEYFEGFDTKRGQRNILLNDGNFRADICKAFAAQKTYKNFEFVSFLFDPWNWEKNSNEVMEVDGDKIRYCCTGTSHPSTQLKTIQDQLIGKIDASDVFNTKKRFKKRIKMKMKKFYNRLVHIFTKNEKTCLYSVFKELRYYLFKMKNLLLQYTTSNESNILKNNFKYFTKRINRVSN